MSRIDRIQKRLDQCKLDLRTFHDITYLLKRVRELEDEKAKAFQQGFNEGFDARAVP